MVLGIENELSKTSHFQHFMGVQTESTTVTMASYTSRYFIKFIFCFLQTNEPNPVKYICLMNHVKLCLYTCILFVFNANCQSYGFMLWMLMYPYYITYIMFDIAAWNSTSRSQLWPSISSSIYFRHSIRAILNNANHLLMFCIPAKWKSQTANIWCLSVIA